LAYVEHASEAGSADVLIIPGSKQTLRDLEWLRQNGFDAVARDFHAASRPVIGICGGMQMLGQMIEDPQGSENNGIAASAQGLGLLAISTTLNGAKVTRQVNGILQATLFGIPAHGTTFSGYEIHLGETIYHPGTSHFSKIARRGDVLPVCDGAIAPDGFVFGTYVHGIFDDDQFRHAFVDAARQACCLAPAHEKAFVAADRERRIDRLAKHVRESIDMKMILTWLRPVGASRDVRG
jgi:adenosylcobyric acid synthase